MGDPPPDQLPPEDEGVFVVDVNDDGGFLLTQTILAMGESTITPEESSAAMEQLARAVAERH